MAKCPPQTFSAFTSECIQALQAKVQSAGVSPEETTGPKTSGTASRAGFGIEWQYDPPSQTLTIQCVSAPFFVPCKLITAQIDSWIRACYPAASSVV